MKTPYALVRIALGAWLMLLMALSHAADPLWTFTPQTPTTVAVAANGTATVKYLITNQTKTSYKLAMKSIPGVTQVTTAGNCQKLFTLAYNQSCVLNLKVKGSALTSPIVGGPSVCQWLNSIKCYQPSSSQQLNITRAVDASYTVGGSVFGLNGSVVLENNNNNPIALNADGNFTFTTALMQGASYSVKVKSQPTNQTCTVSNGNGTVTNANVTNVTVNCSTNTRAVGGTITGLSGSIVIQNNGADNSNLNTNGQFTFPTRVSQGGTYTVTILTQPATQTCTITNASGAVGMNDITDVQITCATNSFTVGGTITGLAGNVVLQNNAGDNLNLNANGQYSFPTRVAQGAAYNASVLTQPEAQVCSVTNGSGTMGSANVTNVGVNCVAAHTNLSTSVNNLALSVTGFIENGVTGTPNSGLARVITISNTGSAEATNLVVTTPSWPAGTTSTTNCGNTLATGSTCTITVTPGATATSNGTNSCSNGTAPIPGIVQVSADNASTVTTNVVVLSYGCIYQSGYVYAFDDTKPSSSSVGGKVITTSNQADPSPNGKTWSANSAGGHDGGIAIYGIAETSTAELPVPNNGQVPGQVACDGATNGSCNTNNIYVYYQNNATGAPINLSFYAAGLCKQTINGYSDWYLPALCELGYAPDTEVTRCADFDGAELVQNMQTSLIDISGLNVLSGVYWSSTEYASNVKNGAKIQRFSGSTSGQGAVNKSGLMGVRCARFLTP
jgi:hypothetical protein